MAENFRAVLPQIKAAFARRPKGGGKAMKRIITPEVSELVCDVTGKPAVAWIKIAFGYGESQHDAQVLEADLCDEVANEVLTLLQSKYPQLKTRDTTFG